MIDDPTPLEGTQPQDGSITKEKLTQLEADAGNFNKLQAEAEQMGFTEVSDYIDFLHEKAKPAAPAAVTVTPVAAAPAAVAPVAPAVVQENPKIDSAMAMAVAAYMETQHSSFESKQSDLSDEEKSPFTKEQLEKAISGNEEPAITKLAKLPKHAGNLFSAADEYLGINDAVNKARTDGANAAAALASAGDSAIVITGGAPAPVGDKLSQAEQNDNDLRANIAPNTTKEFAEK